MTTNTVIVIPADLMAPFQFHDLPSGEQESYSFLVDKVGGYIDCVRANDVDMWVNDEGLIIGLPPNLRASAMVNQAIAGDVVLASVTPDGETVGLPTNILDEFVLLAQYEQRAKKAMAEEE